MQKNTPEQLNHFTILFHWVIALLIIGSLVSGFYMVETKAFFLYNIHKSVGAIILLLLVLRLIWRYMTGGASIGQPTQVWQRTLMHIVHFILLFGVVLLPLSGLLMSYFAGFGVKVFDISLVASNIDALTQERTPINKMLAGAANSAHHLLAKIIAAAVILHIIAALKHHIIDKNSLLKRMLGKAV